MHTNEVQELSERGAQRFDELAILEPLGNMAVAGALFVRQGQLGEEGIVQHLKSEKIAILLAALPGAVGFLGIGIFT